MELADHVEQRIHSWPRAVHAVPGRKEAREDFGIDRFHLVAQLGQAAAPQPPQHGRIAPLALVAVGSELAMHQPVVDFQLPEFCRGPVGRNPEPSGGFGGGERTVGARVAGEELPKRCRDGFGVRAGQAGRERTAERVR